MFLIKQLTEKKMWFFFIKHSIGCSVQSRPLPPESLEEYGGGFSKYLLPVFFVSAEGYLQLLRQGRAVRSLTVCPVKSWLWFPCTYSPFIKQCAHTQTPDKRRWSVSRVSRAVLTSWQWVILPLRTPLNCISVAVILCHDGIAYVKRQPWYEL